jgi:hypothetical protein
VGGDSGVLLLRARLAGWRGDDGWCVTLLLLRACVASLPSHLALLHREGVPPHVTTALIQGCWCAYAARVASHRACCAVRAVVICCERVRAGHHLHTFGCGLIYTFNLLSQ